MSRERNEQQFVEDVERICRSLVEQGDTELKASEIAAQLDGYTTQRVAGLLWANAEEADQYNPMTQVTVEIHEAEDGTNVYHLATPDSDC